MERNLKGKSIIDIPDNYIIFDIETTGLDPKYDEIIEIGAIKINNGEKIDIFYTLIKPKTEIDEFITNLTGITNSMLKDAPSINKILPKFMDFIKDSILVGHNINFDINFIYDNLEYYNLIPITNNFIDTLRISRKLFPDLKHHRLNDLANYYNIDTSGIHRAMKDVDITFEIFNYLKTTISDKYSDLEDFKNEFKHKYTSKLSAKNIIATSTEFDENNLLYGKNVVITGKLEKMSRKDAMQIIVDLGGHCQDKVNKDTNYLILGNNDYNPILKGKKSSKLLTAENLKLKGLDIEILSENIFYDIIPQNESCKIDIADKKNDLLGIPIEQGLFNEKELTAYKIVKEILTKNNRNIDSVRCSLNKSNYFDILLFGSILKLKLRGKKNYAIITRYCSQTYNFSDFVIEECSKNENGKCRLILSDINEIYKLEQYIITEYDTLDKSNLDYIKNVSVGKKNYDNYLKVCYQ